MRTGGRERAGLIILAAVAGLLILLAVLGERLCIHDPYYVDMGARLRPPCGEYLLGTDMLGRCIACRLLAGLKYSLSAGCVIVAVTGTAGTMIGMAGAFFGGVPDKFLAYVLVVFQSFPGFILAIFVAGLLGQGLAGGILALSLTGWTRYARLARSLSFEVISSDYVKAARISGIGFGGIAVNHVLPNILPAIIVNMALSISDAIVSIAGLSFLGLGAAPPTPEWGTMIAEARSYFQTAPWTIAMPGLALLVLVIIFNLFAEELRRVIDPKEHQRGGT